jgi:hypothetical protein
MLIHNQEITGDSSYFLSITCWKAWVLETTNSKGTAIQRGICMANKYWYLGCLNRGPRAVERHLIPVGSEIWNSEARKCPFRG